MTDPFLESIAAALAGQAAAALGAAGGRALTRVRDLVRGKAAEDSETLTALEAAEDRPAGHPKVEALAERLDRLAADDPDFAAKLRNEGAEIHKELSATDGGVVNENSGNVTNLVQGRSFDSITFNN